MKIKCLLLPACLLFPVQFALAAITNSTPAMVDNGTFSGKVIETTNVSSYTYVQVDTGDKKLWAVTTQFPVKAGDNVTVYGGMPMAGYHSKSLNRDFDVVYFTGRITVDGGAGSMPALPPGHPLLTEPATPALPPNHPSITAPSTHASLDLRNIKRADGGKTIQEIYAEQAKLAGTTVAVRGKVVKYNAMILGKNWIHIRDGSGTATDTNNDLTITTSTPAAVGDTVLISGNVSTNRDFGAGYKYSVIIEDARVTIE